MIFILFCLDIFINNFTIYTSFFFIIYLYNKTYRYYLYVGLILDLIILDTYFINVIILSIVYLMNILLKDLNKYNFYNFLFITIYDYLIYIIASNLIELNNLNYVFLSIGSNLIINLVFYILSYKLIIKKIKINNK